MEYIHSAHQLQWCLSPLYLHKALRPFGKSDNVFLWGFFFPSLLQINFATLVLIRALAAFFAIFLFLLTTNGNMKRKGLVK